MIKAVRLALALWRIRNTGTDPKHPLSKVLTKLGPIYIKLGQTISTRPDLTGEAISEDLKTLQDKLPPFSSKKAREIFEDECGVSIDDAFKHFDDTPVAAASIAQVHKARLKNGDLVAVKIVRPDIAKRYASDVRGMRSIALLMTRFFPKYKRLRAPEVVDLFERTMHAELDLKMEAACASELKDNTLDGVHVPKVYWAL